jgi:hypothetical protein
MSWSEMDLLRNLAQGDARILEDHAALAPLPEATPEGSLLAKIRQLAKPYGWLAYHTHDSRHSEAGFPDLVLTNGVNLIMAELKTNTGKLTKDQATWIAMLSHTSKVEAVIWRPADWPAITERLTRGTRS